MHQDGRTGTGRSLSATQLWLLSTSELRSGYRAPVSLIPTVQGTAVFLRLARPLPRGGGTAKCLVCFGGVLKRTTSDATRIHPVIAQIRRFQRFALSVKLGATRFAFTLNKVPLFRHCF